MLNCPQMSGNHRPFSSFPNIFSSRGLKKIVVFQQTICQMIFVLNLLTFLLPQKIFFVVILHFLCVFLHPSFLIANAEGADEAIRIGQHRGQEQAIRQLFHKQKDLIPPGLRLRDDELLCKCNHFSECGKDVADIVGAQYMNVCRAGRGGMCSRIMYRNAGGAISDVVTSCIHREQLMPPERPFICQNITNRQLSQTVVCCNSGSFCNDFEFAAELPDASLSSDAFIPLYLLLLFGMSILFSFFGLCVGIFYCSPQKAKALSDRCFGWIVPFFRRLFRRSENDDEYIPVWTEHGPNSRLDKLLSDLEITMSTGSGAGMPLLAQRTIARQITLEDCIGRGRFGEVYMGDWRGEKVAVKIFLSRDEASWQRETEIYQHKMVRHSNLLRWIASDNKDTGTCTQLWLITEFWPNGSMYDHLERATLSDRAALQFVRSIAHGLAYLHTEVPGVNNQCHKPAIAHRDIKSRNILIKNDWTCCIADLGMAIRFANGEIDIPTRDRGGTARYLAPEFLSNSFNRDSFIAYMQMDIYAFALVVWEICRRVTVPKDGVSPLPYEIPYLEFVPREPTPAEMLKCVCVEGRRPSMPDVWQGSKILAELARIMSESWSGSPQSRLTALNIRCALDRIAKEQKVTIVT